MSATEEIKEMNTDHIVIDADNLPLDMFRQIPDPYPGCDIAIYFNDDKSWHGAWWKGLAIKISGKDGLELDGMVGFYQDNARQEQAEEGA